ncbi:MAG: PKD domain-containing protein, partial [Gammaproteobacteria bacterium]|nr:PKD domain-containing protein [Gammaproteobacteria bacterium]
ATYYAGHGSGATSWAPIMGNSYYKNVTQWSSGEYAGANNTQDDLAVIDSKLGLVDDDHGDTLNSASPLAVESDGQILVSNPEIDPHNVYSGNKGVIEASGDQDLFYFNAAAGQVDLNVIPAWDAFYRTSKRGANLDIQTNLLDASGATLATSDPASDTDTSISANVSAGTYYLQVTGVGNGNYSDYASAGHYFISGSIVLGEEQSFPPTADFGFSCINLECDFNGENSSDSNGSIAAWSWNFGDGATAATEKPSHTYASAGTYNVILSVTDDDALTASVSKSVIVSAPNSPPTADFEFSCTNLECNFNGENSSDSDGSIAAWSWNFGDSTTATTENSSHIYANAGTYSVALTVTDNDGEKSATTTQNVTVTEVVDAEPPVVTIDNLVDGDTVSGRVTLTASATDDQQVAEIRIYTDGDLRCSGTTSASCTWNVRKVTSGPHTVSAVATDTAGKTSDTSVTINVGDDSSKGGNKGRKK